MWASSKKSSWGTVSSIIATCLDESDVKTKSGLCDFIAMHSGNFSCFPRSTFSCRSVAVFLSPWPFHCKVLKYFPSQLKRLSQSLPGRCVSASLQLDQQLCVPAISSWFALSCLQRRFYCRGWSVEVRILAVARETLAGCHADKSIPLKFHGHPDLSTADSQAFTSTKVNWSVTNYLKLQNLSQVLH